MRNLDFSSWQAVLTTLVGLVVITVVMVAIRLLVMEAVQQRRQRENRQINERLRTLIAAYKTLGGSFTGDLAVDPAHLRDLLRRRAMVESAAVESGTGAVPGDALEPGADTSPAISFDRSRRIRDAVEGALSDVILLGTEAQVRLAAQAATELAAGRPVYTAELVVSLRDFIRKVLDLEPVPAELAIPQQGPTRPGSGGGGGGGKGKGSADGSGQAGRNQDGQGSGGGGGGGVGGGGEDGMGLGMGGNLAEGDQGPAADSSPWRG